MYNDDETPDEDLLGPRALARQRAGNVITPSMSWQRARRGTGW